jgi:hypothetical protein
MPTSRVDVTNSAKNVIDKLRREHGELIFHQSGGCCDGTAVMCFAKDEFMLGGEDLKIGNIHGCDFYMAEDQFEYTKHSHITIDAKEGRGSGFSIETSLGFKFITTSRLFTDDEEQNLELIG